MIEEWVLNIMAEGWDEKEGSLLCFTLMGEEHMEALLFAPKTYSCMYALFGIARLQKLTWHST